MPSDGSRFDLFGLLAASTTSNATTPMNPHSVSGCLVVSTDASEGSRFDLFGLLAASTTSNATTPMNPHSVSGCLVVSTDGLRGSRFDLFGLLAASTTSNATTPMNPHSVSGCLVVSTDASEGSRFDLFGLLAASTTSNATTPMNPHSVSGCLVVSTDASEGSRFDLFGLLAASTTSNATTPMNPHSVSGCLVGSRFDLYGLLAASTTSNATTPVYPNSASSYNFAASVSYARPAADLELGSDAVAGSASASGSTGATCFQFWLNRSYLFSFPFNCCMRTCFYYDCGALELGSDADAGFAPASGSSGIYLCVNNTGTQAATFNLTAATHSCPFKLVPPEGDLSICSSTPTDTRYDGPASCPSGSCACGGIYKRPQAAVFPDLGFSDCSAACTALGTSSSAHESVSVETQQPGTWRFFNFSVEEGQRFLSATATANINTSSDLELYVKFWQPPGRQTVQYDARSDPGDFRSSATSADLSSGVQLSHTDASFRPGTWFLGAWISGNAAVSYSLELFKSSCPNDCSGDNRGSCDATSGQCACSNSTFGVDCSGTFTELPANSAPLEVPPRAKFDEDHILVPGLDDLLAGGQAYVTIEASFDSGVALPVWVSSRPSMLITGCNESYPSLETAEHRLMLAEAGSKYSIRLEPSQIPSGQLYITLDNPLSYPYKVGYSLEVKVAAQCINDCSGHGTCSSTGTCVCQGSFVGLDCGVDTATIRNASCDEGSQKWSPITGPNCEVFAVCVCHPDPSSPHGGNTCKYKEDIPSIDQFVVICHEGFILKGSSTANGVILSTGVKVATGGTCHRPPRRGTSGGMVFFFCLLSIFLAAGLAVAGKHGWAYYQAQRFAEAGGYSELPGATSILSSFLGAFVKKGGSSNNDPW
eukprot:gene21542-28534_t